MRPSPRLVLEQLESRLVPATQAIFNSGILTVLGDNAANQIVVAADASGNLQVTDRGQAVAIQGNPSLATRANLQTVVIDGGAGNDRISTDRSLNTMGPGGLVFAPDAILLGGKGDDTIAPMHGGIVGGLAGVVNGVVVGRVVGNCFMDGGQGDDFLQSGFGNDTMLGGQGDDNYLWPPGTLTDFWDGGQGDDTVTIIGNDNAGDAFSLTADGRDVLFRRLNLVQFSVSITNTETVALLPGSGDDTVVIGELAGVAKLKKVQVDGGAGSDTIDVTRAPGIRYQLDAETVTSRRLR